MTFIGRIYTQGGIANKFVIYFFPNIYFFNLIVLDKYQFFGLKKKKEKLITLINNMIFMV